MRRYTPFHEWIEIQGDCVTVGLMNAWINEIGTIVYVELPKLGSVVQKGMEIAVLESTKAAVDLYAPCFGKVIDVNKELLENISLLNEEPESKGWLYKLQVEHFRGLEEFTCLEEQNKSLP